MAVNTKTCWHRQAYMNTKLILHRYIDNQSNTQKHYLITYFSAPNVSTGDIWCMQYSYLMQQAECQDVYMVHMADISHFTSDQ